MDHQPLRDLPMTTSDIDRDAPSRSDPDLLATLLADPATRVVELRGGRASQRLDGALLRRPPEPADADSLLLYLGRLDGVAHLAACHPETPGPPVDREERLDAAPFVGLREVATELSADDASLFAAALGLSNWHARHRYCPRCGAATQIVMGGWVRRCPHDGSEHYPRTDPAVIVAVTDEQDRLLLGRNVGWPEGRFSVLAGFVEPGETIAAAVAREVFEETAVEVTDIEFVADQPWPFPASLMLGCRARATTTDVTCQPDEIAEARWFTREEFRTEVADGRVKAAGRLSIAARLVEGWLGRRLDDLG
ncbi:NAD(+) diphosphatase [Janibacter alittae]|uniref:NAD(+) diphosphatase n=1 Tax=Janibacter alittae TaxID=3115209 RepID=A0ABZ2MJC1_9MICO